MASENDRFKKLFLRVKESAKALENWKHNGNRIKFYNLIEKNEYLNDKKKLSLSLIISLNVYGGAYKLMPNSDFLESVRIYKKELYKYLEKPYLLPPIENSYYKKGVLKNTLLNMLRKDENFDLLYSNEKISLSKIENRLIACHLFYALVAKEIHYIELEALNRIEQNLFKYSFLAGKEVGWFNAKADREKNRNKETKKTTNKIKRIWQKRAIWIHNNKKIPNIRSKDPYPAAAQIIKVWPKYFPKDLTMQERKEFVGAKKPYLIPSISSLGPFIRDYRKENKCWTKFKKTRFKS